MKKDVKNAVAKKVVKNAVANTEEERGARIVVLTDDPRRSVVIVPGCHIDSMQQKEDAYFFEDGNALVGMIVRAAGLSITPPTAHTLCGSPTDGTPLSDLSNIHQRIDHLSSMVPDETPGEDVLRAPKRRFTL